MEIIAGHKDDIHSSDAQRHLPMQSQIALMFLAIMLAFAVFASLLNSWITTSNYEDNLNKKAARYIQTIFNEYVNHQGDNVIAGFNELVEDIVKDKDVEAVGLYDKDNQALIYKGSIVTVPDEVFSHEYVDIQKPFNKYNVRYYKFSFPQSDKNQLATIVLSINNDLVFSTAQKAFIWTFLVSMVAAFCTMLVAVIVIKKFTNPFDRLSKAMESAQLGQRGVRVTPEGATEAYKMATAFNAMISVIERREENLIEQKRALENQIAGRKKIDLEIKSITYRLQAIFDNVTDGIIVVNKDCRIVSVNNSANKIYGYKNKDLIGKDLSLIMKAVFIKIAMTNLNDKKSGEKIANYETVAICKSGKHVPTEIGISLMEFSGDQHYLITVRDITERKKTDGELNEYRLHLEAMVLEQTRDIAQSRDAAMAGERAMSAFLANMSHELRTPMHGVLSFASIALKKIDNAPKEKIKGFLNEIKNSGNNLLDIINDLLDLSKMKSGKMDYNYSSVAFSDIVNDVVRQMSVLANMDKILLDVNVLGREVNFNLDETRIMQVVRNLYANALKFSDKNTSIKITIDYTNANKLVFSILNYGVSVPKGENEIIFNDFEQSSNTRNNAGGTGLGLPICKEIVESGHKGKIFVDPDVTDGARFIVEIPYIKSIDDDQVTLQEAQH